jgi:hypothetical protein
LRGENENPIPAQAKCLADHKTIDAQAAIAQKQQGWLRLENLPNSIADFDMSTSMRFRDGGADLKMTNLNKTKQQSPRSKARIAGVSYLLTILTGIFAQGFISVRLVIDGNAAGTANNILAHKTLFELGFTVYLIEMACQIAITGLFYDLLKPAGRSLSLVAAFLGLAGCIIKTISRLFYIAPLFVLGGAHYLNVFNLEQLQSLALLFLKLNDHGAAIALAFFGFYALLTGYLIVRSIFLPRILGVLSTLGGLGWLTFLYPPLGYRLFPYLAAFGILGAAALIVWLLVFGVNEQRWREQARAAARLSAPI